MKNVIVGTAGHVDHGKTSLIKRLSGIDTDRLTEEKKRGITIELGFANLPNDEDLHIGIIDVPGHEKFVKNMLAGIGGIDLVLLVIALDEGIMPQTVEHFEILKMLHLQQGIIVLTKKDLVDEDWIELIHGDVDELVKGTFLEKAPQIEVSSFTGENIALLKEMIIDKVKNIGERKMDKSLFRLPIDRVFTMEGHGTVVTGTLLEGSCKVGDEVQLYPGTRIVKIRGIQSHGEKEEEAFAGQRTAMNLMNISKEEVHRGQVLAYRGAMENTTLIDVSISLFSSTKRKLKNNDRVHLNIGADQIMGKVRLLDKTYLEAGESGYAQIRLDEEIAMKKNDPFIIRFYSPVETFGGGVVLDANASKIKPKQEHIIENLQVKEWGTPIEVLELILKEDSKKFPTKEQLAVKLGWTLVEIQKELSLLQEMKKIRLLEDGSYLHQNYLDELCQLTTRLLSDFHQEHPISQGMDVEEYRSRLKEKLFFPDSKKRELAIDQLAKDGIVVYLGNTISLATFQAKYSKELVHILEGIEKTYKDKGYEVPMIDEVLAPYKDKKQAKLILEDLEKKEILVKVEYPYYMHAQYWYQAIEIAKKMDEKNGSIALGDYRDELGTSRKYAVLILEAFDKKKITRKKEDLRTFVVS